MVSLTPSATEIVAALGATSLLIGVDDYSTYPPEVAKLPKVGSFLSPNLETIIRLAPTLVIVDDVHGATAGALHDAKITTVECSIHGLHDLETAITTVGARLDRADRAASVVANIEAALDSARAHRPAKRPRVLAIIDREADGLGNLVAAGTGSWLDELLAVVGGENVLAAAGVRYPKVTVEEVLRAQPDVIIDLSYAGADAGAGGGSAAMAPWLALDLPAVKTGHVVALSPIAAPFLAAPSPRIADALAALSAALGR